MAREAEEPPDRQAGELAAQVVERRVERGLRGHLARTLGEARRDLLERERIVAEQLARLVEERRRGRDRLAVVLLRASPRRSRYVARGASSTQTTSTSTLVSREIVNGSAERERDGAVGTSSTRG